MKAMLSAPALAALKALLAENDLLVGSEAQFYACDESRALAPAASAVAFPRTHEQVVDIIQWANMFGVGLVPSGGRTGLSGGACAGSGELVLSLMRMNRLLAFDEVAGIVTVQAGMVLETLQQQVAECGWFYPVDYASKGSAQIGGAVATNAGGIRVLRYGMTRDWVAGIKAVCGNGETLELQRNLVKDNGGYDLKQLLIGSEGTLAVVTEVSLRLTQPMPAQTTVLIGVKNLHELVDIFARLRKNWQLSAAEFFCANALARVCAAHQFTPPFSNFHAFYLLVELDEAETDLPLLAELLADSAVLVSQHASQAHQWWQLRELISSTLNPFIPYKNDIACQPRELAPWLQALAAGFAEVDHQVECVWFGHLGDGNVHLNVMKPPAMPAEAFDALAGRFDRVVADITRRFPATASAEHGIGTLKIGLLSSCRSPLEMAMYRQIKRVFDPNLVLNPGKIWCGE